MTDKRRSMTPAKILALSGSSRRDSLNSRLLRAAAAMLEEAGAEVTLADLAEYEMPLYNGDLENRDGPPENQACLKALFRDHAGLLIAAPEYNSSITPLLKNTIDWVSRPTPGDDGPSPYRGKIAALLAASPGALGGLRGLAHVRQILTTLGVIVLPQQQALPRAGSAFDEAGGLADERTADGVRSLCDALVDAVRRWQD